MKVLIQKNIKAIFLVVLLILLFAYTVLLLLIKLFVLIINLLDQLLYKGVKMQLMNLLKQFLKNINIAKKIIEEYFHKNLITTEEEENFF